MPFCKLVKTCDFDDENNAKRMFNLCKIKIRFEISTSVYKNTNVKPKLDGVEHRKLFFTFILNSFSKIGMHAN